MNLFRILSQIPRQIIFVVIGLAIIVPLVVPIGIPVNVMPQSQKLYNAIDSLGPHSKPVLISCDFDPQSEPELYPMLLALLRHCFARQVKVLLMALWPQGTGMAEMALADLSDEFDIVGGRDYVFLGYKVGGAAVCLGLGESIRDVFPTDYYNVPSDSLELMTNTNNYDDISVVISLSSGDPGFRTWVIYAQSRYGATIGTGVTAVSAADTYHFLETGQLIGLLAGMKGASEYEVMVKNGGYSEELHRAAKGMDAQSLGHLLIMIFIILGNIGYFVIRRQR